MKKILILLLIALPLFFGCKKDEPTMTSAGDWILTDAQLYIKRWDNNKKTYPLERYDLFTQTQKYNCLDINGNDIKLDQIFKDSTRWIIDDYGRFSLDSIHEYETQTSPTFIRVFPTEDGSARIFILDDLSKNHVRWKTSEREQALKFNGVTDNYTYFSKLTFKRKGTNEPHNLRADLESSIYKGVLPAGIIADNSLNGTTWLIYRYKRDGFMGYQEINDTLYFVSNRTFHLNTNRINQLDYYALYDFGNYFSLTIGHTRFGSQISCSNLPRTSVELGDIRDAKFKDNTIGTNGGYYYLSMRRIN